MKSNYAVSSSPATPELGRAGDAQLQSAFVGQPMFEHANADSQQVVASHSKQID